MKQLRASIVCVAVSAVLVIAGQAMVASAKCSGRNLKQLLATADVAQPGGRPPITPLPANWRSDCPLDLHLYWQTTGVTTVDVNTGQAVQHPGSVGWTEASFTGGNSTIQYSTITRRNRVCVTATQVTPDFQAQPLTYRLDWQPSFALPPDCATARDQWVQDIEIHEGVHYQDARNLAQAANTIWQASPPRLKYCAATVTLALQGLQAAFQAAVLNYGQCLAAAYDKRVEDFHKTPAGAAALPSPDPSLCQCPSCEHCCTGECRAVDCGECLECQDDSCVPDPECLSQCRGSLCDLDCPPLFGRGSMAFGDVRSTSVFCACSPCCPGCSAPACGYSYTLTQTNPDVVGMSLSPEGPFLGTLDVPVEVVDGVTQIPTVYYKGLGSGTSKQMMEYLGWCDHIYNWSVDLCQ